MRVKTAERYELQTLDAAVPRTGRSARRRNPGRRIKRWHLISITIALVLVGLGIGGLKLKSSLQAVQSELTIGKTNLLAGAAVIKAGGVGLSKSEADQADLDFGTAATHFKRAQAILQESRLIGMVGLLPGADRQVLATRKLTDMGIHLSYAGQLGVEALSSVNSNQAKQGPAEKVLIMLNALDPKLESIGTDLNIIVEDRDAIPKSGLLPPINQAVGQFDAKLNARQLQATLRDLRVNEPILRQILGSSAPKTYLVLQQDPAELRATGGFIGSVGFLSFDHGAMAPFTPEDIYRIDGPVGGSPLGPPGSKNHVDAPYPLAKVFKVTSWSIRDSNWSPDFPTSAQTAERFLALENHRHVDGVIAIDPFFVSKLLSVIGPTVVPETGDVVTEQNFYSISLARVHPEQGPAQGKSFLSQAANAIFPHLTAIPSKEWLPLMQAVQSGCDGRAVQAYFNDPAAEAFVSRSGCAGQVRPLTGDGLMIVESNIGGNKDDFWMNRNYSLRLAVQPDGSVVHTLVLHYSGLTSHGPVTGTWGYTGWLRVYLPSSSDLLSVTGANLDATNELGRSMVQGWFYVQFGSTPDVTIVYRTAPSAVHSTKRHLEVFWQKQAGRLADPIHVAVTLPASWKLVKSELDYKARPNPIITDLSVDRDVQFWFQPN